MADEIIQKRSYELDEYTQLIPGEPLYEDPAGIWLNLDKVTWPEAKKFSLLNFIASLHKEQGPVLFTSDEVTVVFGKAMTTSNYYLKLDVWYNRVTSGLGTTKVKLTPINLNKTVTGFTFKLPEYNSNYFIDYLAFE